MKWLHCVRLPEKVEEEEEEEEEKEDDDEEEAWLGLLHFMHGSVLAVIRHTAWFLGKEFHTLLDLVVSGGAQQS